MLIPDYLKAGDTIAITAPSGYLPYEKVQSAQKFLEQHQFKVLIGNTFHDKEFYFSDTDANRLADLQYFLNHPEVKAIWMARGGYGLSRIIDDIDFTQFVLNPKWLIGFSDITVLHAHIQQNFGIASLHASMCGAYHEAAPDQAHLMGMLHVMMGKSINIPIIYNQYNKPGNVEAELVGGNLAILAHLTGSRSQLDTRGKILFIEDIGEHLYNVDRMLLNLKRAGMLNELAGLVCGQFTDMEDTSRPFGQTLYEIIADKVAEFNYPVCYDLPCGHEQINYPLLLGAKYHLNIHQEIAELNLVKQGVTLL